MSSVTQDWVQDLPWKMQSVLMTATRGPDNHRYASIKTINRWIRSHVFHDADPSNPFITDLADPVDLTHPTLLAILEHDLEYVTVHYFGHLIHALSIIAYEHPNHDVCHVAFAVLDHCVSEILHLQPEDPNLHALRLADTTEHA